MKLDWKNILGAGFFVAALLGSGAARSFEAPSGDPRNAMVCQCLRSGNGDPGCEVIKEQTFGTGGANANRSHMAAAFAAQQAAAAQTPVAPQTK